MEDWQIDYDFCLKLENWETYILHVLTNQISVNTPPPPPNTSHTKFHPKCLRVKFYQAFKNNAIKLKFVYRNTLFILFFLLGEQVMMQRSSGYAWVMMQYTGFKRSALFTYNFTNCWTHVELLSLPLIF